MRLNVLLVALLLPLAGCLGDTDAPEPTPGPTPEPTPEPGPEDGNETANVAPTVSLAVNVTDAAPFNATFTLTGTDPDGDELAWTLDADDDGVPDANGTGLPADATFAYGAEGDYTAVLNVTDGTDSVEARLNVTVAAGAPALQPFVGSGTAQAPCFQCSEAGANTGVGYRAGESGVDSVFFDVPAEYVGQPFTATASVGDVDMVFRDACSEGNAVGESYTNIGDESGTVPEGATCVLMWNYLESDSTLTLTIG